MKKILFYVEDTDYKSGLASFLNYYPELKSEVELVPSRDVLSNAEDAIIISDSETLPSSLRRDNSIYKLSNNPVSSRNELYKYSNIKDLITSFLKDDSVGAKSEFHIYTVSSPIDSSGKSVLSQALAEILSRRSHCATVQLISDFEGAALSLSDLMILNLKCKNMEDSVLLNEKGYYQIPGFRLLRDYVELDIKNFKQLLSALNRTLRIDFFILELPSYLDQTGRELLKLSKLNLIVCDQRRTIPKSKLEYLQDLSESSQECIVLENFCERASGENQLPMMRKNETERSLTDEEGVRGSNFNHKVAEENEERFAEGDYYLFKHKLAQCLGDRYA